MEEARNLENSFENSWSTKGGLYYATRLSYAKFLRENNARRKFKVIKVIACTHPVCIHGSSDPSSLVLSKSLPSFETARRVVSFPPPPPPEIERVLKNFQSVPAMPYRQKFSRRRDGLFASNFAKRYANNCKEHNCAKLCLTFNPVLRRFELK